MHRIIIIYMNLIGIRVTPSTLQYERNDFLCHFVVLGLHQRMAAAASTNQHPPQVYDFQLGN